MQVVDLRYDDPVIAGGMLGHDFAFDGGAGVCKQRYTAGALRDGTGSLAGARDVLEVRLQAARTTETRRLTLWIISTGCRAGSVCVHLTGSLRGQLVPVRTLPDIGRRYAITATGSLYPVGALTAAGTVAGTGTSPSALNRSSSSSAGGTGRRG